MIQTYYHMDNSLVRRIVFLISVICIAGGNASAGPPFLTDDPVPIDYRHAEAYLFSTGTHDKEGTNGLGPAVEFNYGFLPDFMIHFIVPMAYDFPRDESSHFGYGDTEIGIKCRFVHETEVIPMIGAFPLLEIPTGNPEDGLGSGEVQSFLPIWIQKNFGNWTTYGGGGYWINPGTGNRNFGFVGILLQYAFSESFYLGGELFYQTPDTVDGEESLGFNVGGSLPLAYDLQLLFSAGRSLQNNQGLT